MKAKEYYEKYQSVIVVGLKGKKVDKIQELVAEGRRIWAEGAAQGSLAAIAGRSRVTEAEALLDVDGLGGFLVAEWRVG